MGFKATMVILREEKKTANENGSKGENHCVLWSDSDLTIDFGHVTRLEKVVGNRFKYLDHTSFRRAGICTVDCFLKNLFEGFDENPFEQLAPEILVHKDIFGDRQTQPTKKVGGRVYIDCPKHRLDMEKWGADIIANHNTAIGMSSYDFNRYLQTHQIFLDGPLLWASCVDLACWLSEDEEKKTEGWGALVKDKLSLAIARGWRHQLSELGETGARALFRFS